MDCWIDKRNFYMMIYCRSITYPINNQRKWQTDENEELSTSLFQRVEKDEEGKIQVCILE
jgi:hypothetical protein